MSTTMTDVRTRRCTVYRRGGGSIDAAIDAPREIVASAREPPGHVPVAGDVSLRSIMSSELICVRQDLEIHRVVGLMIGRSVGCLPVVDQQRRPIGVITKFDLVEQLEAAMRASSAGCPLPQDLPARTADEVMMPIALTLDEHATIAHAAAMMASEEIHHVLVVDGDGALVGVVSAKDIVHWLAG
jgi:CBS domain-containing protein